MMNNIVITIGREYGSGGRYIGELLSKKLNIPFYDKELIVKAHEKNNCNYSKLEEYDEVKRNSFLKQHNLYDEEIFDLIREKKIRTTFLDSNSNI